MITADGDLPGDLSGDRVMVSASPHRIDGAAVAAAYSSILTATIVPIVVPVIVAPTVQAALRLRHDALPLPSPPRDRPRHRRIRTDHHDH